MKVGLDEILRRLDQVSIFTEDLIDDLDEETCS